MSTREPIDAALWNLFINDPGIAGQFVTTGRYLVHFEDVPREQMPALFITQKGESWVRNGKGIPAVKTLKRSLVAYVSTREPTTRYPSALLNALMDVVENVVENPGNPQNTQTLGGLVEHVYLEGEVVIDEGLLQDCSIFVAPLTILLP